MTPESKAFQKFYEPLQGLLQNSLLTVLPLLKQHGLISGYTVSIANSFGTPAIQKASSVMEALDITINTKPEAFHTLLDNVLSKLAQHKSLYKKLRSECEDEHKKTVDASVASYPGPPPPQRPGYEANASATFNYLTSSSQSSDPKQEALLTNFPSHFHPASLQVDSGVNLTPNNTGDQLRIAAGATVHSSIMDKLCLDASRLNIHKGNSASSTVQTPPCTSQTNPVMHQPLPVSEETPHLHSMLVTNQGPFQAVSAAHEDGELDCPPCDEKEDHIISLQSDIEESKISLQRKCDENEQLRRRLIDKAERQKSLQRKCEKLEGTNTLLWSEYNRQVNINMELQHCGNELAKSLDREKQESKETREKCAELESQITSLKEEVSKLEYDCNTTVSTLISERQEKDKLKERVEKLEEENAQLKHALAQLTDPTEQAFELTQTDPTAHKN